MIDRYKSGFVPPEDFQFETASGGDTTDSSTTHHHTHNHLTAARGTVSGNKIKKRTGLLAIFSSNKVRQTYMMTGQEQEYCFGIIWFMLMETVDTQQYE